MRLLYYKTWLLYHVGYVLRRLPLWMVRNVSYDPARREAEQSLLDRENRNRSTIATLRGEDYTDMTLEQFRDKTIRGKGKAVWERWVKREQERLLAARWSQE